MINQIKKLILRFRENKTLYFSAYILLAFIIVYIGLNIQNLFLLALVVTFLSSASVGIILMLRSLLVGQEELDAKISRLTASIEELRSYKVVKGNQVPVFVSYTREEQQTNIVRETKHLNKFIDNLEKSYRKISQGKVAYIQLTKIRQAMNVDNFEELFVETKRTFPSLLRLEKGRNGEPLVKIDTMHNV